nr:dihydrodipicolinate synthase family protein [Christiangramia fulva]
MLNNMQIFAATYTPFKKDLSLNPEVVPDYGLYLQENKVHGIFINGSTGDFVSLSTDERMQLLEAWKEHKGALTLINHVGDTSLEEAKRLAFHSQGKADAIAAIAPFYFKPSSLDQLVKYCEEIAACAPDLPFYYYHLPALTGVNFNMVEFLKRASQCIENFAGIKFTENNLVSFQETNDQAGGKDIFFGVDEAFLPSLAAGAKGWVGSTFNHLMPLYQSIADQFYDTDLSQARELQSFVLKFVQILSRAGSFNGGGKSFMKSLGIDCGPSRFPHPTLTDKELQEVREEFGQLGISNFLSKNSKVL